MFVSCSHVTTFFSSLLVVSLLVGKATSTDYIWSPTLLLNNTPAADWNTPDNWTPQGVPTTPDTVSFPATTNISSTSALPVSITSLRIDAPINVTFVSSLAVSGIVRVTTIGGTLTINGAFSAGGVELSGMLSTFNSFNVDGTFSWVSGQIYVHGDTANINNFVITGSSGFLDGDINILKSGSFTDASRFLGSVALTVATNAVLTLSVSDATILSQFTPQQSSTITNNGNITVAFTLSDTASIIRFGVTPPASGNFAGLPTVTLVNNGNLLITGSGFLEVSNYAQNSGSLILAGYYLNQLGLRTIPTAITYINGGYISGDGWIDSELVMASGTALYLSVSANFTITKVSLVGNALIQTTFFDTTLHGILLTSSFNARTSAGGILRVVMGNGPNAQIDAAGFEMVMRDVVVSHGESLLFIAPISFSTTIPAANLLAVQVENDNFDLEQVPVQFSTTSQVYFFNVTRVSCDSQCNNNGDCVYPTATGKPHCECNPSSHKLKSDCSRRSYTFLAWIIGPSVFGVLIIFEIIYCFYERQSRKKLIRDPTVVKYVRPELSAFRARHRQNAWSRTGFDFATLFLFTTEYEGSARSFDLLSKILLTTATVAVGLLAIIPFSGDTASLLQPIFTGINAGLTFTLAAIQLGWTAMKPRKVEFDVEVDDKKINLWAPFNKETLGWILLALPIEMNRLYTPPTPYTANDFRFQDTTLDLNEPLRLFWINYYRLPKVLCTRVISTSTSANPAPPAVPPSPSSNPPSSTTTNPITNPLSNPLANPLTNPLSNSLTNPLTSSSLSSTNPPTPPAKPSAKPAASRPTNIGSPKP